jgi:hypothetical protein
MINLTELEKMCEAATRGPWYPRCTDDRMFMNARFVSTEEGPGFRHDGKRGLDEDNKSSEEPESVIAITLLQSPHLATSGQCDENAAFIAASRTAMPELLRLVRGAKYRIEIARYYMNNEGYVDMAEKMSDWLEEVKE